MNAKQNYWCLKGLLTVLLIALGVNLGFAQATTGFTPYEKLTPYERMLKRTTQAQREAAAAEMAAAKAAKKMPLMAAKAPLTAMDPGGVPDYFNVPNWANSPKMRKFVDTLPGVGAANANNLGQFIPIAVADTTSYPGSDYYKIGLVDFTQQLHSDLFPTKLRGYKDLAAGADGKAHYLGPLIIAKRDRPVRLLFTNMLGAGAAGKLFLPVDTSVMGAGMGPLGTAAVPQNYTENRANIHMHGGATPWISDGTPHQWITPAGETSPYKEGISVVNVPDMPAPPAGSGTYYYTNQQSNRLMFYHDHAFGITRLNVYAGEVAGYLLTDPVEDNLIDKGILPGAGDGVYRYGIPLIIQDKTFVDPATIVNTDPTWNWGSTPPVPHHSDLWMPHVYMPNQNTNVLSGANAFGRWDYGPWFWPPYTAASGLKNGPIPDPRNPGQLIPGTPNPSQAMESFLDTAMVNGQAYPKLTVQHRPYRFRILNGCNERVLNLQLYYVDPANPTEVKMVPAIPTVGFPPLWPTDGRVGGVPDPTTVGPDIIQIGTEGGFLPGVVVLPNQPIGYVQDRRNIVVLNVGDKTLLLGPAERADIIIDFSQVPANSKIMLYNDAPAPMPAFDPRFDYYTGAPDLTATGGAPTPLVGFGPNTRTIMRFDVAGNPAGAPFNLAALQAALPSAYVASQPPPIIPQTVYPPPYQAAVDTYSRIQDNFLTYTPVGSLTPVTTPLGAKAIQELFELEYGRMNATLGVELPLTNFTIQTTIPLGFLDPMTEILTNKGVQIWKITHNGVDTHAVHFHLFNVQIINRVGWDGAIRPPDANELGWKETVMMNPLEDCIVAFRSEAPLLPFEIPESIRPVNPAMPENAPIVVTNPVDGNFITITNALTNYGWEYVWHCHMLGHEEMDFMRPMALYGVVAADYVRSLAAPTNLSAVINTPTRVTLNWVSTAGTGVRVERAPVNGSFALIATLGAVTTYVDNTVVSPGTYLYRVTSFSATASSLPSNVITVLMTVPAVPTALTATSVPLSNPPAVSLTWVNTATNETGLTLQRSTSSLFPPATTTTFTLAAGSTSYTDATVANLNSYYYRINTFNGLGSSAFSNIASVVVGQLPSVPTAFAVTGTNMTIISLSWTPGANSTNTRVQRGTSATGPWTTIAAAPNTMTAWTDTGLTANTTYWYRAQCYSAAGNSPFVATISAVTIQLPSAPTALRMTARTPTTISMAWTPGANSTGTRLQVGSTSTGPWTTVASATGLTKWTVTGLTRNTGYWFSAQSYNASGNSPRSAAVLTTTAP